MLNLLFIALCGAAGAISRYGIGLWLQPKWSGETFPLATLVVNAAGSFLLGFLAGLTTHALTPDIKTALSAGFLGALTTFSTFSFETVTLLEKNRPGLALGNVTANLALGLIVAWLGIMLARSVGR